MSDRTGRVPAVKALAMPADTNPSGDVFGGWILAQMDIAGGVTAFARAGGRTATVAIETMTFMAPIHVGDLVSVYAEVVKVGTTSLTIVVEAWARRGSTGAEVKVTEGRFIYVALDADRKPRPLPPEAATVTV